ncbi:MAG: molybdenum cofactor biosynthesis protein MoaE [Alphaproteobacteria bacterium]|jgi:molybdopterin synthase catalytic subunit|nr:molybdenum cofactor biosynthesis protein MoaE [Alphaproteobacteria bacterium]MDP6564973.1 molybdenum cofactor biosynthesis protein MoaE [Alphaproteobacteria bacterium]MDP6811803.1 molybdenum cofactor biosynthesis protein MoaE [Alphaproteobacteria bacterium]
MIRVQREDFEIGAELSALTVGRHGVGGVASFIGLVREMAEGKELSAMTLEHYPGMTERQLAALEDEALTRWPLDRVLIVHRYGRLAPGEQIVLCVATASHRQAAFEACAFMMDWLKTKAPFWKLEEAADGAQWVEARDSDDQAVARWANNDR